MSEKNQAYANLAAKLGDLNYKLHQIEVHSTQVHQQIDKILEEIDGFVHENQDKPGEPSPS